jgi:DNA-binding transcriptional regulator GbsR (MarR family)
MPRAQPSLVQLQDRFIAAWGQMGSTWGISRTMAEVHALLYITGGPMCTDEVMERLAISRGNASMSLRALVDWGIIEREHKRGDRKEYFRAEQDVWALLKAVIRERMKREVHPVMASLAEIRDATSEEALPAGVPPELAEHNQRLDELLALLRMFDDASDQVLALTSDQLRQAAGVASQFLKK